MNMVHRGTFLTDNKMKREKVKGSTCHIQQNEEQRGGGGGRGDSFLEAEETD